MPSTIFLEIACRARDWLQLREEILPENIIEAVENEEVECEGEQEKRARERVDQAENGIRIAEDGYDPEDDKGQVAANVDERDGEDHASDVARRVRTVRVQLGVVMRCC